VFPIKDFADKAEIDFVKYELEEPKYDVDECQQRGMTFAAPLRVTLRLSVFDVDEEPACVRSAISKSKTFTWSICR
jgi:DNA-directed RNA polymerase subunit beta